MNGIVSVFFEKIGRILTNGSIVFLFLLPGVFFTLHFRGYQIRGIKHIAKSTVGTLLKRDRAYINKGISPFQAVSTALAGTMGVGNIAGVATAVTAGGPGSVIWMWVGAFFGMMTKYAEIFLAMRYRRRGFDGHYYGGPMYYMRYGVGSRGLAGCFAMLCIMCSFGIGNLAQINSVSGVMLESFGVPPLLTGCVFALLLGLVLFGGVKRIARVAEFTIPFISISYLCFCFVYLWIQREMLLPCIGLMMREALGLRAATGGALGYGVIQVARFGLARGVFTNEAGLGSAPIAHAAADCESPSCQAMWGVFEVFLDTVVVCTMTAMVILTACGGTLWRSGLDGAPLTSMAFESLFSGIGANFIAVSIAVFAFAAMIGWYYYGEQALSYLTQGDGKAAGVYRFAFLSCAIAGTAGSIGVVWGVSDSLNALMMIPNIIALMLLRREISVDI